MNYFLEITKKVEEFCNTTPSPDNRASYLECAGKISELHSQSITLEEEGVKSNDERVIALYLEISKLL